MHENKHLRFYDRPEDPQSSPFLYGNSVKMLLEGGPWRSDEKLPTHYDYYRPKVAGRKKIRTKPHQYEFYCDEFLVEPDVQVSNVRWTGQIIKHMKNAGFSPERAEHHLSNPAHVGGAFYRWIITQDETFFERYWLGSEEPKNTNGNTPSSQRRCITVSDSPRKEKKEIRTWPLASGAYAREQDVHAVMVFLAGHPESRDADLREAFIVPGRAIRNVVAVLEEKGFLSRTKKQVTCKAGRKRNAWVFALTAAGEDYALNIPRAVEPDDLVDPLKAVEEPVSASESPVEPSQEQSPTRTPERPSMSLSDVQAFLDSELKETPDAKGDVDEYGLLLNRLTYEIF